MHYKDKIYIIKNKTNGTFMINSKWRGSYVQGKIIEIIIIGMQMVILSIYSSIVIIHGDYYHTQILNIF